MGEDYEFVQRTVGNQLIDIFSTCGPSGQRIKANLSQKLNNNEIRDFLDVIAKYDQSIAFIDHDLLTTRLRQMWECHSNIIAGKLKTVSRKVKVLQTERNADQVNLTNQLINQMCLEKDLSNALVEVARLHLIASLTLTDFDPFRIIAKSPLVEEEEEEVKKQSDIETDEPVLATPSAVEDNNIKNDNDDDDDN